MSDEENPYHCKDCGFHDGGSPGRDQPPGVARFNGIGAPGVAGIPAIPGIVVAPGIVIQVDGSNQLGAFGWVWAFATPDGVVTKKEVICGTAHSKLVTARNVNAFLIMGTSGKGPTKFVSVYKSILDGGSLQFTLAAE